MMQSKPTSEPTSNKTELLPCDKLESGSSDDGDRIANGGLRGRIAGGELGGRVAGGGLGGRIAGGACVVAAVLKVGLEVLLP